MLPAELHRHTNIATLLKYCMWTRHTGPKRKVRSVTPKGRIINSCAVDHWTIYIHIMGTVIRLTPFWTVMVPIPVDTMGVFKVGQVIYGHPKGKPWNLPPAGIEPPTCKP
jgi:hypothetical protein